MAEGRDLEALFRSVLADIVADVAKLEAETEDGEPDEEAREAARESIQEDPLSIEVRSGWYTPGASDTDREPAEYKVLLGTGGPAVRIVGDLSDYGEPETATLEVQDWFVPWQSFPTTSEESAALLSYAQQFYFSE